MHAQGGVAIVAHPLALDPAERGTAGARPAGGRGDGVAAGRHRTGQPDAARPPPRSRRATAQSGLGAGRDGRQRRPLPGGDRGGADALPGPHDRRPDPGAGDRGDGGGVGRRAVVAGDRGAAAAGAASARPRRDAAGAGASRDDDRAMKIAMVTPYDLAAPGGVNRYAMDIAGWVRGRGHEVQLIGPASTRDGGTPPEATIIGRPRGVRGGGTVAPIALDPRLGSQVRRLLRRERYDVVHVHEPLMPMLSLAVPASGRRAAAGQLPLGRAGGRAAVPADGPAAASLDATAGGAHGGVGDGARDRGAGAGRALRDRAGLHRPVALRDVGAPSRTAVARRSGAPRDPLRRAGRRAQGARRSDRRLRSAARPARRPASGGRGGGRSGGGTPCARGPTRRAGTTCISPAPCRRRICRATTRPRTSSSRPATGGEAFGLVLTEAMAAGRARRGGRQPRLSGGRARRSRRAARAAA